MLPELGEELVTYVFLAFLAAAWIAVFLPAIMRARQDAPLSSAERFRRRLELIAPRATSQGRWVLMPEHPDRLARAAFSRGQRRRTRILIFLIGGCLATLGLALAAGGGAWEVQFAFDVSLALYVVLLLEAKRRRAERRQKVRTIGDPVVDPGEEVQFYEAVTDGASGG
jgi:hypothetical protein